MATPHVQHVGSQFGLQTAAYAGSIAHAQGAERGCGINLELRRDPLHVHDWITRMHAATIHIDAAN